VLLCVVGGLFVAAAASAQLSPGPLAQPHAELDGSSNCLECHAQAEGVSPGKCLTCHELLAERIDAGLGLHARADYADCRLCHIDHHGREYELVWWGEAGVAGFDHADTGYTLTGSHEPLECRDCHKEELITTPQLFRAAGKTLNRTFLGLETDCLSCHQDEHRGQFADRDCATCHGTAGWTPPSAFDHGDSAWPLTGRHVETPCGECHRSEGRPEATFVRYRPLEFARCSDCHSDPHEATLGPQCDSCHVTDSWRPENAFDHSTTEFALTGAHRSVGCRECHTGGGGGLTFESLPFAECSDCHADPHEARLGPECESCHVTASWREPVETGFDHKLTSFALEGAHARVTCSECHRPGEPLRIASFETCSTCHEDAHLGQFAGRAGGQECDACHDLEAFSPSLFTVADHEASPFPLVGRHRETACSECHREIDFRHRTTGDLVLAARFSFETLECGGCHDDPHAGAQATSVGVQGCASCHSETDWLTLRFDHEATGFHLVDAHARVECKACHGAEDRPDVESPLRLAETPTACRECHETPHGGQFDRRNGGCAACHATETWTALLFDHQSDTAYPLEGAHLAAPCASCHLPNASGLVLYAPLPTDCTACHGG